MANIRTLKANEIQLRVGQCGKTKNDKVWASYLLYKDARCDMAILDETFGCMNWQKSYTRENANCIVSVYDDEKKQWISKEDTGTESFTEQEKGLASDSFKRACVNWGIGRELYTAPNVNIWLNEGEYYFKNDKVVPTLQLQVKTIEYENRVITRLVIVDNSDVVRFNYGTTPTNKDKLVKEFNSKIEILKKYVKEETKASFFELLKNQAKVNTLSTSALSEDELERVLNELTKAIMNYEGVNKNGTK